MANKRKRIRPAVLWLVALVVVGGLSVLSVAAALIISLWGAGGDQNAEPSSDEVRIATEAMIRSYLRVPGSAKFGGTAKVKRGAGDKPFWLITGRVEAQNAFGVPIVDEYFAQVNYERGAGPPKDSERAFFSYRNGGRLEIEYLTVGNSVFYETESSRRASENLTAALALNKRREIHWDDVYEFKGTGTKESLPFLATERGWRVLWSPFRKAAKSVHVRGVAIDENGEEVDTEWAIWNEEEVVNPKPVELHFGKADDGKFTVRIELPSDPDVFWTATVQE